MMSKVCAKLSKLPDGFTVTADSGFINVTYACKNKDGMKDASRIVSAWADENMLAMIGTGTDALTSTRDWCFERRKPKRKQ